MVLETNGIIQPVSHLAQIISLTTMGTQGHVHLHIKDVIEILMPLMVACVSLADVCSAGACFLSGCIMPLVSNTKVNLSQSLPPQLVCYQGEHSVVKTPNQFLQ